MRNSTTSYQTPVLVKYGTVGEITAIASGTERCDSFTDGNNNTQTICQGANGDPDFSG